MGYWETAGQGIGIWLGLSVAMATAPVVVFDGPLPIIDAVWLGANIKNTDAMRRRGQRLGSLVDDYIENDPATTVVSENIAVLAPESSSVAQGAAIVYDQNIVDAFNSGEVWSMGNFLNFGPIDYKFVNYEFTQEEVKLVVQTVQDLTYIYRNQKWPQWNS